MESTSSLCDMMNTIMADVLNEIMSIQACGAEYGKRSDARVNSRNGYHACELETTVGMLQLKVPKLRSGSYFPTDLFERWSRTDRALAAAVAEMYVTRTSTRKVEKVARKFGVESLSKDQVTRLCAVIDGEVDAFLAKDWSDHRFAYLFLDATYVKCRVRGRVRSEAFITAISVGDDGHRHFLGFTCANAESHASWRGFLQDLEERGVRNVRLVTSDCFATLGIEPPPSRKSEPLGTPGKVSHGSRVGEGSRMAGARPANKGPGGEVDRGKTVSLALTEGGGAAAPPSSRVPPGGKQPSTAVPPEGAERT